MATVTIIRADVFGTDLADPLAAVVPVEGRWQVRYAVPADVDTAGRDTTTTHDTYNDAVAAASAWADKVAEIKTVAAAKLAEAAALLPEAALPSVDAVTGAPIGNPNPKPGHIG